MSEADPSMEIAGEAAANAAPMMDKDIPAMKEVAKEVMETISSEVNGKNSVNGELANGGLGGTGWLGFRGREILSQKC